MRLEEYWGVGPKTRERLEAELGAEAAVAAIEAADVGALVAAGLSRGRATTIVRRAKGGEGLSVLATRDARSVYKDLLDLASEHAVTERAADRIRVLTPLRTREAIEDRLDDVLAALESWRALGDGEREATLAAFDAYDSAGGGDRAAVEAALELREAVPAEGVFARLGDLDAGALRDAADALAHLEDGGVAEGADGELDRLRAELEEAERLEGSALDVLGELREAGVRAEGEFREAVVGYLDRETGLPLSALREAAPEDAADAADFVGETVRSLAAERREAVEEREAAVAAELEETIESARGDVDAAAEAVSHLGLYVSLARFADAFDLVRPEIVEGRETMAVEEARNLGLAASGEELQPVTYAVGEHGIGRAPSGDRVAVLTGANSGGKTTLLETLCQVSLLAQMGLPVPATRAEVSVVDAVVFHRRHASFNAGVLESTLKSIVPPLSSGGRTLMLVDEFEAITEPGSAADLLHGLVSLSVERDAIGAFVTHLADDLRPLPESARIDGIVAQGLNPDLELIVDYQPRFGEVGRSTPEFIVSRLVANAGDRSERAGFERLAEALGEEAVQRTLADARWVG